MSYIAVEYMLISTRLMEEVIRMLEKHRYKLFWLNWACVFCMNVMCAKSKIGFSSRACFNFSSGKMRFSWKAKLNSVRMVFFLPFSSQVSTQSLTVDSMETYFCKRKNILSGTERYTHIHNQQWNSNAEVEQQNECKMSFSLN